MAPPTSLHVAQISFHVDPVRGPSQILQDWWPLVDCAEMVAQTGARVSVVQACVRSDRLTRNGVNYHFVRPEPGEPAIASGREFAALMRGLDADVFHVHGLSFPKEVLGLAKLAPNTPIFLQDHASGLPRFWRRRPYRRGLAVAGAVSFCALEQAKPFIKAGMLSESVVHGIPECSSRFTPGDQPAARRLVEVHGDPAVLWVGHFDTNKDPLTVLAGVAAAVSRLPELQLWCCFGTAPLEEEVRRVIDGNRLLRGRVHLLGKVPHEKIEQLMRAADVFALGSHREGSGCAVIEALACGLPPVVTDIPSFRALTGAGRTGALWPCDDARAFTDALLRTATQARNALRIQVRAHFDAEVSFHAVGHKLRAVYENLSHHRAVGQGAAARRDGERG